jgi:hypothetical protein
MLKNMWELVEFTKLPPWSINKSGEEIKAMKSMLGMKQISYFYVCKQTPTLQP